MVDLDELERLEREATPGPWKIDREELGLDFEDEEQERAFPERIGPFDVAGHDSDDVYKTEVDAVLVADTRNALPDLLAEIRTLRARVAELERDARLGAVVREAVGDDEHLFEAFAEPVRREHADTGIERAPVYDRVPVAIADALRAEEGGLR